jgi:hypothetical protein
MAVAAVQLAEQRKMERRLLELELQPARYDAFLPNAATPPAIRTTDGLKAGNADCAISRD